MTPRLLPVITATVVLILLVISPVKPSPTAPEPQRLAQLEDTVSTLLASVKHLSASLAAAHTRIADLESQRRSQPEHVGLSSSSSRRPAPPSQTSAPVQPVICPCNTFNTSTVTIGGETSTSVNLVVGSPQTGTVNGVNVAALNNEAVRSSGDQSIAGGLSVQSLSVGTWTVGVDSEGSLVVKDGGSGASFSFSTSGGLTAASASVTGLNASSVTAATLTASSSVSTGNLAASGSVTAASVTTKGSVSAASVAASSALTLAGHNTDPSSFKSGWCDCYWELWCGFEDAIPCPATFPVPIPGNAQTKVSTCGKAGFFVVGTPQWTQSSADPIYPLAMPEYVNGVAHQVTWACCRPCLSFA